MRHLSDSHMAGFVVRFAILPDDSWEFRLSECLRESYAVCDHLTIDHRARGCNESCDWWPRVEAIKGRNK